MSFLADYTIGLFWLLIENGKPALYSLRPLPLYSSLPRIKGRWGMGRGTQSFLKSLSPFLSVPGRGECTMLGPSSVKLGRDLLSTTSTRSGQLGKEPVGGDDSVHTDRR